MSAIAFRRGTTEEIPFRIWDEATPRQRVNPDSVFVFDHNLPVAPEVAAVVGWDGQIVFDLALSQAMVPGTQYWLAIGYTKGGATKATSNFPVGVFE